MDLLFVAAGLVILLVAGDLLVRGAVNLALRLGVPAFVVSLTIVAFGTSAPELLVSVSAVLDGVPGLALGNVVGSNIANVLLVLGLPALISGLHVSGHDTRRSYWQMLGATALFITLAFLGPLGTVSGLVLLAALGLVLWQMLRAALADREAAREAEKAVEGADLRMRGWKVAALLVAGLVGLPVGAELLVTGSTNIARAIGVSDAVIGLTLVAIGTSLPELATTVIAALRRQADVALGNVIGSNLFNLLFILGAASLFGTIPVDAEILRFDLWVMAGASLLLGLFVLRQRDMARLWGAILLALYAAYLAWILLT